MADAAMWRKRVSAWRASGMTAAEFAEGKGFAEGTLRWWAWRLGGRPKPAAEPEAVRLVQVVRSASPSPAPTSGAPRAAGGATIDIELGGARVSVGAGADPATVREVIEALGAIAKERSR